jgi:hypothetical protein
MAIPIGAGFVGEYPGTVILKTLILKGTLYPISDKNKFCSITLDE